MADVQNEPRTRSRRAEMKLLLDGFTPSRDDSQRVKAYSTLHELLEQIGSTPGNFHKDLQSNSVKQFGRRPGKLDKDLETLCLTIQQDIVSSREEIAVLSLRVLGIILRLAKLTDTEACNVLKTWLAVLTTKSRKRISTLGLWCISTQELSRYLLGLHLKRILATLVHAVDNPRGSPSITCEAFQALTRLTKQLPHEMREHSVSWAPSLYHKLLDWKTSELAEKCLSDVETVVFPPIPELTEALVTDIQVKLMKKMKSMVIGNERESIIAVRAWRWLIKFLAERCLVEQTLINELLQILEISFTSSYAQVRNSSQVAWMSLIDTFVPLQETGRSTDISGVHFSLKRLKLLMTPLVTTISWEKVVSIQRNCFCTWIYLLCRLGVRVNGCSEFGTVVLPMLEAVFKLGPKRTDGFVWATCVDVFKSISACNNSRDPSPKKAVHTPDLVLENLPRKSVVQADEDVLVAAYHQKIEWRPWGLDRLDSLLNLVKLLWTQGVAQFEQELPVVKAEEQYLEAAVCCWRLLVRGVKAEENASIRPSGAHVTAVHLLLNFFYWARKESQRNRSTVWQLAEILIEALQPVILTSYFYKVQPPLECLAKYMTERVTDSLAPEEFIMDTVAPVVFIWAVWFDLILRSEFGTEPEDLLSKEVTTVITTARSGFDVMGTFLGFAWILDCLGTGTKERPDNNMYSMKGDSRNRDWDSSLSVWRTVADQLREHIDRAGAGRSVDTGGGDSDYNSAWVLLLYPVKFFFHLSLREYHESETEKPENAVPKPLKGAGAIPETQLLRVESTWFKLYDSVSRISSCKPSSSNPFIGGFFSKLMKVLEYFIQEETHVHSGTKVSPQCMRFLVDVIVHAMKHAEIPNFAMLAISRKRRKTGFGGSSVRVQYLSGVGTEDASHLRDLLSVASKILSLCYIYYNSRERHFSHNVVISMLGALAGIAQQTTSQTDALRLLKTFSQPFTRWLSIGAEGRCKDGVSALPLGPLQDALSQAWDGLLSCLQACHPGLTFDSALLDVQAPTLALALVHTHGPTANRSLSFWNATYGSQGYPLKYPSVLAEVLCKLRGEVEIALPGWSRGTAIVKQKFSRAVYSRHPLTRFMPQSAGREQHVPPKSNDDIPGKNLVRTSVVPLQQCSGAAAGSTKESASSPPLYGDVEFTAEKEKTSDFTHANEMSGVKDREHLVRIADEVSPTSGREGGALPEGDGSFEDFMRIVDSALKKIPEEASSISSLEDFSHTRGARSDGGLASVPPLLKDRNFHSGRCFTEPEHMKSLDNLQESQRVVLASKEVITDGSPLRNSALITPPVTSIDVPFSPPKIRAGGEDDVHITEATLDPIAQESTVNTPGSKVPQRRKKLKFQDPQDRELGVPQSLQERSFALDNNGTGVQNFQKVAQMDRTSVHIRELRCLHDVSNSPAGTTEVEDCGVSCKENVSSNVHQNFDSDINRIASIAGRTELGEHPSGFPLDDTPSAGLRSSFGSKLDLLQMKERIATLWQHNPTVTYREIARSEQYEALPKQLVIQLKKHLDELRTTARLRETNTAAKDEETARLEELLYNEEEKLHVTVDAVNLELADCVDGQRFTREDTSTASLDQETNSALLSGEEDADYATHRESFGVRNPSRRPRLRRMVDMFSPYPEAVNSRSRWKLRGGKQLSIDAEAERSCTLRPGSKRVTVRRRRPFNSSSVPLKEERSKSAPLAQEVIKADLLSRERAHVSKVPLVKPDRDREVLTSEEDLQGDDTGFRIRELRRRMFDMSYGATEVGEPDIQEEVAMQRQEQFISSNHIRKCRFPKRVYQSSCSDVHHKETTSVVTEAEEAMSVDGSLPCGEIPKSSPLPAAASQYDEMRQRLHNQVPPPAESLAPMEEPHYRQEVSTTDQQSQDGNCKDLPNNEILQATDPTPYGYCSTAVQVSRTTGAEDRNHQECGIASSKRMDLTAEIERLLQCDGVRVYHILAALVASPQWGALEEVEVSEAERLISKVSRMLTQRKENGESPIFRTPPTHFI